MSKTMRMGGFSEDDGDLETVAWGVGWPPDVCWRNHRPNVVRKTFNLEHLSSPSSLRHNEDNQRYSAAGNRLRYPTGTLNSATDHQPYRVSAGIVLGLEGINEYDPLSCYS